MRYKTELLNRIDSIQSKMDYLNKQIGFATVSGPEAIKLIADMNKQLENIKSLIEAESN